MTFSCDKYDNIRRKAFNDVSEVENITVYRITKGLKVYCFHFFA